MQTGKPFDLELIIVTAKGNERWVRAIGQANRRDGETIGLTGIFQDIHATKKQELAYKTIQQRKDIATSAANIGVWDFDIQNQKLYWNDKMYQIFDVPPNKFSGNYEAWKATVHPDDLANTTNEIQALNGEKPFNTDFRIIKTNGSIAIIHAEAEVIRNANGEPLQMVGINVDITAQKEKMHDLEDLLDTTEDQNKKLIDFAYIVSHNIRSSSSNISMLAGMLLADIGEEKRKEFLQMIQTSSESLEETLNDLNDVLKVQSINETELKEIDGGKILDSIVAIHNDDLAKIEATIENNIPESLKLLGIKKYIIEIFNNLITNSVKYREPSRKLEITVDAQETIENIIVNFKDNGTGLDLEKYGKQLFGMYKSFHSNNESKGVGLFINKSQMEAMNGKIEVESELGVGTTFKLIFPNPKLLS